jgi:hypothetical protein
MVCTFIHEVKQKEIREVDCGANLRINRNSIVYVSVSTELLNNDIAHTSPTPCVSVVHS